MSSSTHQIKVKAVDQTGGVFSSIQQKAANASSKLGGMLKGALAAAGAYMGVRAISQAVSELGNLSDVAMRTSTSVEELTKTTTALKVLGINADINGLARAFQLMEKNTGRTGLSGFYQTIEELAKVGDVAKRGELAMKVFGRSGMEFMPLINAANEGTVALQNVVEAMPRVPEAAAQAGDKLNDAKEIGVTGFKNLWLEAVGKVCEYFDTLFVGGVRQASMDGVSYINYFVKVGWNYLKTFFTAIGLAIQGLTSDVDGLKDSLMELFKAKASETWAKMKNVAIRTSDWTGLSEFIFGHKINVTKSTSKERERVQSAMDGLLKNIDFDAIGVVMNEHVSYQQKMRGWLDDQLRKNEAAAKSVDQAAKSTASAMGGGGTSTSSAKAASDKITNSLIMAGSNAAFKLATFGPQLQIQQKQLTVLQRIEKETAKTAENTQNQNLENEIAETTDL